MEYREILLQSINKIYMTNKGEFHALDNIDLKIRSGESISILGESGSGKSTLAKIISKIEKHTSGQIFFDKENITNLKEKKLLNFRKNIQTVFQDTSSTLNPKLSVLRNMEEGLINLTNYNKNERKEILLELMKRLNMKEEILNTPVRKLSGGEARRVSLIRALGTNPSFLVLDEITSGLDLISQDMVLDMISDSIRNFKITVIFVTHDEECAKRISNRLLYMDKGKIKYEKTAKEERMII
ncbi:ATP-binding cassette domain-containing protein [Tissierella praeacuta]|uniref:ATP-binding cassette domain-containing protein n=1 Tax=Tissierella praeacuta TaxID=43131 RepID=UPI001C119530|nr:dipeptide/oligopeptide/nickel ABC transporter ATP-binding protein [Tissierella praeacuta]MBU5255323.1 dipeptide/oligopeptide/nickel ABC transporter ATP-binding protein [Tissierella praeacuta]